MPTTAPQANGANGTRSLAAELKSDSATLSPKVTVPSSMPGRTNTVEVVDPSRDAAEAIDRVVRYTTARFTGGLSPAALAEAYFDWALHLAWAPGKQSQLWQKAF